MRPAFPSDAAPPMPPVTAYPVDGALLAGGKSSRLGRDKATLSLPDRPGEDFLTRGAALLAELCADVLLVGRIRQGYRCVLDNYPDCGPLGGIATALERAEGRACLVLSCDLPFMTRALLERLLAARAARPAGVCATAYRNGETGVMEALVAVYEQESLPLLRERLARGERSLQGALEDKRRLLLPYGPEQALCFHNINTPRDLEKALKIAAPACGC